MHHILSSVGLVGSLLPVAVHSQPLVQLTWHNLAIHAQLRCLSLGDILSTPPAPQPGLNCPPPWAPIKPYSSPIRTLTILYCHCKPSPRVPPGPGTSPCTWLLSRAPDSVPPKYWMNKQMIYSSECLHPLVSETFTHLYSFTGLQYL